MGEFWLAVQPWVLVGCSIAIGYRLGFLHGRGEKRAAVRRRKREEAAARYFLKQAEMTKQEPEHLIAEAIGMARRGVQKTPWDVDVLSKCADHLETIRVEIDYCKSYELPVLEAVEEER